MKRNRHVCGLAIKEALGLPRLAPNATSTQKIIRFFRKLALLNPNHYKCKALFRNNAQISEERKNHISGKHFYVIHPLSTLQTLLKVVFFITWMYALLLESMMIVGADLNLVLQDIRYYVVIPLRMLLVAVLFNVGYVEEKTKTFVLNSNDIVKKYLKTYFIFDFMTTYFPYYLLHVILESDIIVGSELLDFRLERGTEMLCVSACCVRIYTLLDFLNDGLNIVGCIRMVRFIILRIVKTLLYLHILACFMFYVPYLTHDTEFSPESWTYQAGLSKSSPVWHIYSECLLLTLSYFFGIAERYDVKLVQEQICIIIISFCGRMYTLFLLAEVLKHLGMAGVSESMYERQMAVLQEYMNAEDLPKDLRRRMLKYFQFRYQGHYFKESEILKTLSDTLRTELFLFSANKLIKKVKIFKKLPNSTLGAIIAEMKSEIYSPRDVIAKAGSKLDKIYFVSTGTVALFSKDGVELTHLEDGADLGTSAMILSHQIYSIVAVETTELFTIDKNMFMKFLKPYPEIFNDFCRSIVEKMANLKSLEYKVTDGHFNVMSELQKGNILEQRVKKEFAEI